MSLTPGSTNTLEIFYSYAHEDEQLLNMLDKHLSALKWDRYLTAWYDRNISAGTVSMEEIFGHLNRADVILLLVSPDFISSDYHHSVEMQRALERHEAGEARVIPIILRPVVWENAAFAKLEVLPTNRVPVTGWDNLDEAFLNITRSIQSMIESSDKTIVIHYKTSELFQMHPPSSNEINYPRNYPAPIDADALRIPFPGQIIPARLIGPDGEEKAILPNTPLTIGRSPANQLVVNDPGVSSYHAEIHPQGSGYSIIALESTNGTYVNGYKLRPNIQSPLNPGDIIYIGRIVFYYMYKLNYAHAPQTKPYDVSPSISGRPKGCRLSVTIAGSIALVMLIVFTAYAYDTFVRIPSDQSMLLTTFCNALKSQQYMIAYDLLSSRNKRSISETQFAHEFGGNDDAFKITGCVIKSSPANNSSGTIALTFANGSTVNDTYTLVQENGIWKIDLKSP